VNMAPQRGRPQSLSCADGAEGSLFERSSIPEPEYAILSSYSRLDICLLVLKLDLPCPKVNDLDLHGCVCCDATWLCQSESAQRQEHS
jgi:hypothetical protein